MTDDPRPLILHVIHHLFIGGLENGLVNLINRLPAAKYRHAIACIEDYSDFRDRLTRPDVEVFALHRSRTGLWKLRRDLFRLCRALRPAILHSRNLSALDALLPARLARVAHCVHGEHGRDVDDLHGERRKPALLRRLHAPLIDRYITVSKDLRRYLVSRVGIAESRITQIYNGVDTQMFCPAENPARDLFPAHFTQQQIVIGTVGRIQPVKDQATLVRAFARLTVSSPQARARLRLAIVGDGPMLGDLRSLVASLGIAEQTWLPGALRNIPEVLRGFDVFVLPSLAEGISNTILEAMASGLPILATAVGGNVELVEEGVTGRCFPVSDANELARLLGEYVSDPALRTRHAAAARAMAVSQFSLHSMVENYEKVYDGLLQPPAR